MDNTLQNTIFAKLSQFSFPSFSSLYIKKSKTKSVDTPIDKRKPKAVLPNPALELPVGILPIDSFQQLVDKEKAQIQKTNHNSFILQLNLIHKNCGFLKEEAQKILALDCLKHLQKNGLGNLDLGFSDSGKLWLLLCNSDESIAINNAKTAFNLLRKFLRAELDIQLPLVELNMYKVNCPMPIID